MDTDPVAVLHRNKADILQRLVSLSRDPQQAQALITDLSRTEAALAKLANGNEGEYCGIKKVRDAIKELLEDSSRPLTEDEIKTEIVDRGGFRRGNGGRDGARLIVPKSIKSHLPGCDGHKRWPLKKINGLIGLDDWPNEMFGVQE